MEIMRESFCYKLEVFSKRGREYYIKISKEREEADGAKILRVVFVTFLKPLISKRRENERLASIVETLRIDSMDISVEDLRKCIELYDAK